MEASRRYSTGQFIYKDQPEEDDRRGSWPQYRICPEQNSRPASIDEENEGQDDDSEETLSSLAMQTEDIDQAPKAFHPSHTLGIMAQIALEVCHSFNE